MTGTARRDAEAMGYATEDVVDLIQRIGPRHFYKSMTANHNARAWQDVYHVPDRTGVLYVKFSDNDSQAMTVLSFKEK